MIMLGILALSLGNPILISNHTHAGQKMYSQLGLDTNQTLKKLLFGLIVTCGAIILVMIIIKANKFNMMLMLFLLLGLLITLVTIGGVIMSLSIKIITSTNKNNELVKTIANFPIAISQVYLSLVDGVIGILFGLLLMGSFINRMLNKK